MDGYIERHFEALITAKPVYICAFKSLLLMMGSATINSAMLKFKLFSYFTFCTF